MKINTKNRNITGLIIASSAAMAITSVSASAQQTSQSMSGDAGLVAKSSDADLNGLQEVVVTAQKRKEKAKDVPASVSVVGQAQLENQHVTELSDLSGYLPSVQIDNQGSSGQTAITIRGIPALGNGATVGTYLDDTPVGSSSLYANGSGFELDMFPYDVSRIEVLRGPQGTLYGASSMGGLLKYVMNDPELDSFNGRIATGISDIYGGTGLGNSIRGMVNIPIIKDELAARISLSNNRTPGYIDNALTGQSGINNTQQQGGRLSVLWKPTSDLNLKFSALHQKVDANDQSLILLDGVSEQPIYGDQKTGKLISEPYISTFDYYSFSAGYDLHWADFLAASSYSKSSNHRVYDQTYVFGQDFPLFGYPVGLSAYSLDVNLKKFTQELRMTSKQGSRLEWIIGGFYTRETSNNDQYLTAQAMNGSFIDGFNPLLAAYQPASYAEQAIYGDLTYKITEKFDVSAGLRYSRNNQEYSAITTPSPLLAASSTSNTSHQGVTTYMLSPRYHIDADNMLYSRIATGYRPGGPNPPLLGIPQSINADTIINYELGAKSYFLNKRASVDFSVYQIDWKNIQLPAVNSQGLSYVVNAGTAASKGFELTATLALTNTWRISANASYTDARLTGDAPSISGKNGDTLEGIPRFTSSFTSDYSFSFGDGWSAHVGGGFAFTGDRNSGESSDPNSHRLPGYGIMNLNSEVSKGPWVVRAYVKNVLNNQSNTYLANVQDAITGAVPMIWSNRPQPRTVGAEMEYAF